MQDSDRLNEKLHRISQIYNLPTVLSDDSLIVNSATTIDNYRTTIIPKHAINFNPNNIIDESQDDHIDNNNNNNLDLLSNNQVFLGHCIANNGGIPINNLSKIPSYQWGFKHEDGSNNNNSDISNSGIGNFNGNSISSLPGNVTTINSTGLNARMIRLPIINKHINKFDKHNDLITSTGKLQGGKVRSLMNGLPYYDYELIEHQIRSMNLHKKISFKASNTNTSWFSDSLNKTIDDVEYLHGQVILNQFINNKRLIRNYQWIHYWKKKLNTSIDYDIQNENLITLKQFNQLLKLRRQKFEKLMDEKTSLLKELYDLQKSNNNEDDDDKINTIKEKLFKFPETENEIDIFKLFENIEKEESSIPNLNSLRFGRNIDYNSSNQLIYEKEYSIDDPELEIIHKKLYDAIKAKQLIQDARSTNGIIHSKIVKLKRSPNPNALGFSNIKSCKPSYL
ncbi:hypothetical protein CANINC_004060 [Pichia inconspicua]|uniref:Uncharacterized protein n=1 Tax=Pichia inconspicua TaxID=52247 RepID=A0A4T0WYJ0_9ASCO|nr:hypothetical protein CANINC_004060 [[Candida] inconspicua]